MHAYTVAIPYGRNFGGRKLWQIHCINTFGERK